MACWSDLPAELHSEVFKHIFSNTTFRFVSHQDRAEIDDDHKLLCLLLVSKNFASQEDIIKSMLSQSIIYIPNAADADHTVDKEVREYVWMLPRFRRLELDLPADPSVAHRLSFLKTQLPNLKQIHVHSINNRVSNQRSPPEIYIKTNSQLYSLLTPWETDTPKAIKRYMKTYFWYCPEYPSGGYPVIMPRHEAKIRVIYGCDNRGQKIFIQNQDVDEKSTLRNFSEVFSNTAFHYFSFCGSGSREQEQWKAQLIMDSLADNTGVDVTVELLLNISVMTSRSSVSVFEIQVSFQLDSYFTLKLQLTSMSLQPVFFCARDMCLRFFLGETEVIIPQTFSQDFKDLARSEN